MCYDESMEIYFDMKEIRHILSIMHKLSQATATCFDHALRCKLFIGIEGTICLALKNSPHPELRRACHCSDAANADFAFRNDLCYMYTCPAGISEIVMPIRSDHTALAYYMLGKFIAQSQLQAVREQILALAEQYGDLDADRLIRSLDEFPILDDDTIADIRFALRWFGMLSGERGFIRAVEEEGSDFKFPSLDTDWEEPNVLHVEENAEAKKIADYIVQNLENHPSVSELCERFSYSGRGLNRLFKMVYHQTVYNFCDMQRLKQAQRLLTEQGIPMSDIADKLGFRNASYFSQWFKKRMRISPLKFRKRMRALLPPPHSELPTE